MRRALPAFGALAALLMLAGCATWQDDAHAEALARCEREVEPDKRAACRDAVVAAAEGAHRAEMDKLGQRILEAEERERQRKVYGGPGQVDR